MTGSYPAYALWAFAAGVLIPVMAELNGTLSRATGNPYLATVVLFAVGLAVSAAVLFFKGFDGAQNLTRVSPQLYLGGVIVAFYVLSVSALAPRFGVGNTILFVVAAQIVTSAIIDHFARPAAAGVRLAAGGACIAGGGSGDHPARRDQTGGLEGATRGDAIEIGLQFADTRVISGRQAFEAALAGIAPGQPFALTVLHGAA
jgi:transporter family-2 protein